MRSVALVVLLAAVLVGCGGDDDASAPDEELDRAATRILDATPVYPDSESVSVQDRQRRYVAPGNPAIVLQYYRDELPPLGWEEQSVDRTLDDAGDVDEDALPGGPGEPGGDALPSGPGNSNRGPTGGDVDGGLPQDRVGTFRAEWTRDGTELVLVIRGIPDADPQTDTNQENADAQVDYRLKVDPDLEG